METPIRVIPRVGLIESTTYAQVSGIEMAFVNLQSPPKGSTSPRQMWKIAPVAKARFNPVMAIVSGGLTHNLLLVIKMRSSRSSLKPARGLQGFGNVLRLEGTIVGAWRRSPPLYFNRATERIPFAIR